MKNASAVRFVIRNVSSIVISLILALLVWTAAVREQNPPRQATFDPAIPVEITPPAEGLVNTTTLPDTVRLELLAPESSWQDLSTAKFKAFIDLSALPAGFADVPVSVAVSDRQIEIVGQSPAVASVNLEAEQVISLPVQVEILDTPPLGYINRTPTVDPAVVTVSGPASIIPQAEKATAEFFMRNSKETLQLARDVVVKDKNNLSLKGVTITPAQVDITVPIEQRFGYKDVSVRVVVQGQVAPGYRVNNISVNPPTLTVVGSPKGLAEISGLIETVPINLDQAAENIIRTVPLNLPDGVTTVLSEQGQNGPGGVQVTVEVTPIEDGITVQRPVTQQGIDPDYWWKASPSHVGVFLSGPLPQIDTLRASDVEVVVDLFNLEPGLHVLKPTVFKPDELRLDTVLPDTTEITIGRSIERPLAQQGLEPTYTWTATPNLVKVNLFGPPEALQALNPAEVEVIVNLAGAEPGIIAATPIITVPDGIMVESILPDTIDVTIDLSTGISPVPTLTATVAP